MNSHRRSGVSPLDNRLNRVSKDLAFRTAIVSAEYSGNDAVIIGAGPAGMGVALMLLKLGWSDITIVEKRPGVADFEPDKSFVYLIDDRGQQLTDLIGITADIIERGVPNDVFKVTSVDVSRKLKPVKLKLKEEQEKVPYWIRRTELLQVLFNNLSEAVAAGKVRFFFHSDVRDITQRDGSIHVSVRDVDNDASQSFSTKLLVGADGISSVVRDTCRKWSESGSGSESEGRGGDFEMQLVPCDSGGLRYKILPLPPSFPIIVSTPGSESPLADPQTAYNYVSKYSDPTRSLRIGVLPVKDSDSPRSANLITVPTNRLWTITTGEEMYRLFEENVPQFPVRDLVAPETMERFAKSQGGRFPVPQYSPSIQYVLPHTNVSNTDTVTQPGEAKASHADTRAGAVLVGDSIHSFPPDLGQGVNSALEDVYVLHRSLVEASGDLSAALRLYQQNRGPNVRAIAQLIPLGFPWQYGQDPQKRTLFFVYLAARILLNKALPFAFPPHLAFTIRLGHFSYTELLEQHRRADRNLAILGAGAVLAASIAAYTAL